MLAIEELRKKMRLALKEAFQAEGFNYAWNEEKIGGQSVPHFHLHVVPRKEGDKGTYKYEPREFLYRPGARHVSTPNEELLETVTLIQKNI
jgi:diadenosine tetraphosphate (Ap4A) HIT family hydrolase